MRSCDTEQLTEGLICIHEVLGLSSHTKEKAKRGLAAVCSLRTQFCYDWEFSDVSFLEL